MSLVENLVSQISANGINGVTKPQGFDLSDTAFEDLFQKKLDGITDAGLNKSNFIGNMGAPAGFIIEPYNSVENANNNMIGQANEINEPITIKDIDLGSDYFSDLLKNEPDKHTKVMDLAKKVAAAAYNTFGRDFIESIGDLNLRKI